MSSTTEEELTEARPDYYKIVDNEGQIDAASTQEDINYKVLQYLTNIFPFEKLPEAARVLFDSNLRRAYNNERQGIAPSAASHLTPELSDGDEDKKSVMKKLTTTPPGM